MAGAAAGTAAGAAVGPAADAAAGAAADAAAPDINELFPSFNEGDRYEDVPPHVYTNISLDIEKLDISKFKKAINTNMRPKLARADTELANTRRHVIVANPSDLNLWDHIMSVIGQHMYFRGYNIMVNQLHCDMILQLIYMAKSQITTIENSPFVNTKDTAYRIGALSFKCRKIFKKISQLLGFMRRWQYSFPSSSAHIVLHHRTVRLHIDFLYYYWVVIKLDALYRKELGDKYKNKLPDYEKATGGISIEDSRELPMPGQPKAPPGQPGPPPGQPGVPPGQPGPPPGQPGVPPGQPGVPPGQPGVPPGQPGVPPGQLGVPPGQPGVPPSQG